MSKVIIDNRTNLPDDDAIRYALHVISGGRISGNGQHYCYATIWPNGVCVYAQRNLRSDTFTVTQEEKAADNEITAG